MTKRRVRDGASACALLVLLVQLGFAREGWTQASAPMSASASVRAPRGVTIDDQLAEEHILEVVPSPTGRVIAVVIERAQTAQEWYKYWGNEVRERADVWLVPADGSTRRNLTHGLTDGAGYSHVAWSPNGRQLAMLSTQGHDNARLYVWDAHTDQLRRMSERGVDLLADFGRAGDLVAHYEWLSDTTIGVGLMQGAEVSVEYAIYTLAQMSATREWAAAERGMRPTRSVLDMGPGADPPPCDSAQVAVLETRTGRVVATTMMYPLLFGRESHTVTVAPDQRRVAVAARLHQYVPEPRPATARSLGDTHSAIAVMELQAHAGVAHWSSVVLTQRFQLPPVWAPDGRGVAIAGTLTETGTQADVDSTGVWWQGVDGSAPRRLTPSGFQVSSVRWPRTGGLLVYGRWVGEGDASVWSRVDTAGGALQAVATPSGGPQIPSEWVLGAEDSVAFFVDEGRLWAWRLASGQVTLWTDSAAVDVQGLVWPAMGTDVGQHVGAIVVRGRARGDSGTRLWRIATARVPSSAAGRAQVIAVGGAGASEDLLRGYSPASGVAMYGARRWSGHEWLWLAQDAESRTDTVVSLNALNDRLVGSRQRTIWYHGVEGDSLMGKIIFPVDYVLGRRYPMIVDGYAGGGPDGPIMDTTSANTLDLFAAHGYVVLIPTIPLVDDTLASDPYIDLTKGVFGAIDEAIALGIADPRRLGVYGTSYGGYTTYSLLTYTHRFQAAVATAGPADLMSTYGTFNAQGRYVRDPMPILAFNFFASEGGQWRMGAMPWTNLWRYWRNSPINYLDRVDTPLLIVQGDMDFVPVQQGEEVFTGLSRLGKRVRFIRYWGEGHWANSPANQRDMWQQMLGWFDKYLQPERVAATSPVVH